MRTIEVDRPMPAQGAPGLAGPWLCLAVLLFFLITTTPYQDLTGLASTDPSAAHSNTLNQAVTLLITAGLCVYGLRHPLIGSVVLQPRWIVVPLFIWLVAVSAISSHPDVALRKVVLSLLICIDAGIFLLLPSSDRQFAKLLLIATGFMLGFAYFGVIVLPGRAIHQFAEILEPGNAGLWRGQFSHKNVAAAVMVTSAFFGLYAIESGFRVSGILVVALAAVFLLHTGGKSSTAYLPASVVFAWIFLRWRWTRIPIAIGGPLGVNVLAIGCALSDRIGALIQSFGIDPTFTNRVDIWRVALPAIAKRPITGYGFQGFWQTPELFYSGGKLESWAVQAYNGHNTVLDTVLTTGLPSLVLLVLWVWILPLRDIARAERTANNPALTRLFVRIWLYGLYSSCLETIFFQNGEILWFSFLFALVGLRLQSGASVVAEALPAARLSPVRS